MSTQTAKDAVKKYGTKREDLLAVLQYIVAKDKYLSNEAMQEVAESFDISAADVYGTASFYSFLDTTPRGKNIIRICRTISCDMKHKQEIIDTIEEKLHVKLGETTHDQKFSFLTTNCLGWCHKAPAMLINDKVYTELTPAKVLKALEEYN